MNHKTIPIFLAFLCMGFADAAGPLTGLAKEHFQLTNFVAQLIPFMGFIMFGFLSVPMGLLQDRVGKKRILLLGLAVALGGMVLPITGLTIYAVFLAILLLGAGASILQVAGNPIMRDVSAAENYSRNLTAGQFVKAIGSLSGSLIPLAAARWWGADFRLLFPIYSVALLVTVILVGITKVPRQGGGAQRPATLASCLSLLRNGYILLMVLGIFIYVGAEQCISSGVPTYLKTQFGIDLKTRGILGSAYFTFCLLAGRFLGSVLLNWISARKLFLVTMAVSILGLLGLLTAASEAIAIAAIVVVGLGFANVFPLVFSITVDHLPERSNEISGLMVTAIVGGAFVPPLMGLLADHTSVRLGLLVPLACALYLAYVSVASLFRERSSVQPTLPS
jgi:fucose permease